MVRANREAGYSLYELLMTVGLFALLLALGVPSFGSIAANNKLQTDVNALFHGIHEARKASIVRRRVVSICPTTDGRTCGGRAAWSSGWLMYIDVDRDGHLGDAEPVLKHHLMQATHQVAANRDQFSLRSIGRRATNGTLIFCDIEHRTPSRALIISYTGRPRVAYEDRRGRAYDCPD